MKEPSITVLMSVHNGRAYLREAIDSVLSQTFPDFEFLIIDDASTDDSLAIIQSYADPRIKVIVNERNMGLTASLNIGLRHVQGEWIARLDADDRMLPTRLQVQLQYVHEHPCSVCFSNAIIRDESTGTESVYRQEPWPVAVWTSLFCHGYGMHPTAFIKKSRILESGGYDGAFLKAQDYDLFDRLCAEGEVFGYVEESLIIYRRHTQQISQKGLDEQEQCARRVSFRAMRRYLPGLTDKEVAALRWLFLGREQKPTTVADNLIGLARRLVHTFLRDTRHSGYGRLVYESCLLSSFASRYSSLGSFRLRAAAWCFACEASIRTLNGLLLLRRMRRVCR
jgi:glycosyltransferase involved in cell wall biosynthesis